MTLMQKLRQSTKDTEPDKSNKQTEEEGNSTFEKMDKNEYRERPHKQLNKRNKSNMSVLKIMETVKTALEENKTPPLVTSPKSLFKILCDVHNDTFPNLLPHANLKIIEDSLPSMHSEI